MERANVHFFECCLKSVRVFPGTKRQLDYGDVYRLEGLGPGGYLRENFVGYVEDGFGGTVLWINNSQGFRNDKDFSIPPPENTFRILSMGDSFTGGYRVGQDQTFSFLAEQALSVRHMSRNIEVMVSVIEDPLTGHFTTSRAAASTTLQIWFCLGSRSATTLRKSMQIWARSTMSQQTFRS